MESCRGHYYSGCSKSWNEFAILQQQMSTTPPIPPGTGPLGSGHDSGISESELEHRAERYSELHGEEDEVERKPGFFARIMSRLRGGDEK